MITNNALRYQLTNFEQQLELAILNACNKPFHITKNQIDLNRKAGNRALIRYRLHKATESIYLAKSFVEKQNDGSIPANFKALYSHFETLRHGLYKSTLSLDDTFCSDDISRMYRMILTELEKLK